MGNILQYKGNVKKGDIRGVREILGTPFMVRRNAEHRSAFVVVRCKCGDVSVVRLEESHRPCRCCKNYTNARNGESRTRLCQTWYSMTHRCENEKQKRYHGRGIKVCQEWVDSFDEFKKWAMASGYTDELTIDRINNDGDYEPGNCRWATAKEQASNRGNTVIIEAYGERKTQEEWSRDSRSTVATNTGIMHRRKRGLTNEQLISGRR